MKLLVATWRVVNAVAVPAVNNTAADLDDGILMASFWLEERKTFEFICAQEDGAVLVWGIMIISSDFLLTSLLVRIVDRHVHDAAAMVVLSNGGFLWCSC